MEETLKIMIENLVDNKDEIEITSEENGNRVNFKVKVNKDEMGKVIRIRYEGTNEVLDDDNITVYGTVLYLTCYTTVTGVELDCPYIDGKYFEIN